MKQIWTIVWYDYLQRIRSYRFLIIICVSLAIASTFLPGPEDGYSTIRIGDYVGNNNSAWVAYVTAIMASAFVSWIGYYLINSSIRIDQETKVGIIVSASSITNFQYLLSKYVANILILLTVVMMVLLVSIVEFFAFGNTYSFEISQFLWAYLFIPIPSIILVAAIAVMLEVFLVNKSLIQNTVYFFAFAIMIIPGSQSLSIMDPFGMSYPTGEMVSQIAQLSGEPLEHGLNIGYTIGHSTTKYFDFAGVPFNSLFVIARLLWIILGVVIIFLVSRFFHRFELKASNIPTASQSLDLEKSTESIELELSLLPPIHRSTNVWAVYRSELTMMLRSGKKWLLIINMIGMGLLVTVRLDVAHVIILPTLWFLQVHRWADIVTKEKFHRTHYFIYSSNKPVSRIFVSQLLAGISLAILLALPLIIRFMILGELMSACAIVLGSIVIILLSTVLGILTNGKRLFEILFFVITYFNVNRFPWTDYFGGMHNSYNYLSTIGCLAVFLGVSAVMLRTYTLRHS